MKYKKQQIAVWAGLLLFTAAGCAAATAEYTASSHAGELLMKQKCGGCHRVYTPAEFSRDKWSKELPEMKKKAKLTPEQEAVLYDYVFSSLDKAGKNGEK